LNSCQHDWSDGGSDDLGWKVSMARNQLRRVLTAGVHESKRRGFQKVQYALEAKGLPREKLQPISAEAFREGMLQQPNKTKLLW